MHEKLRTPRRCANGQLSAMGRLQSIHMGVPLMVGIMALMLSGGVQAQNPKGKDKPADSKALIATGKTLFVKSCALCHGISGQGGEGPNLQKLEISDLAIKTTIKDGVKGEMPAFGSKFKDADVRALTAFIRSLKK